MKHVIAVLGVALLLLPAAANAEGTKRKSSAKTKANTEEKKEAAPATGTKEASAESSKTGSKSGAENTTKPRAPKTATKSTNGAAKKQKDPANAPEDETADQPKSKSNTAKIEATASAQTKAAKPKLDKPPQDNAGEEPTRKRLVTGPNITLDPEDLADFDRNPEPIKRLIVLGLELTRRGLTYRYGSSDPSTGGMDCSGTIYYLLKAAGVKEPPRDSSGIYLWAQKEGTLHRVSPATLEESSMSELRPGDLLFWEGTYEVQRDPPISHTMIYLGREKKTGIHVMVGSSDGRTYGDTKRNGVSVFDFKLPRAESAAKFVAYARVPGFR